MITGLPLFRPFLNPQMKTSSILLTLFLLLAGTAVRAQETTMVTGKVIDATTQEALIGVTIRLQDNTRGTVSNEDGLFKLEQVNIPGVLVFSYLGYEPYQLVLKKDQLQQSFLVVLTEASMGLEEIVVKAGTGSYEIARPVLSHMVLTSASMHYLPSLGGEQDPIKAVQLLPGIKKTGDGQNGMLVRGGNADQNLILLDDIVVYNPSHLLGFFSVFNPDVVQSVGLYKGAFPAQFGGRLSSVMEINTRDGNASHWRVQAGLGLLSSRLSADGPVFNKKATLMLSARRTYVDQVFRAAGTSLPYHFYDLNGALKFSAGKQDHFRVTFYSGDDVLRLNKKSSGPRELGFGKDAALDFGSRLGNLSTGVQWKHYFRNPRLQSKTTVYYSSFSYGIEGSFFGNDIRVQSRIEDIGIKTRFTYALTSKIKIEAGVEHTEHWFTPNKITVFGDLEQVLKGRHSQKTVMQEAAIYLQADAALTRKLSLQTGLRMSGAHSGKFYYGLEPRLLLNYVINGQSSLQASYSRMFQYMHLVSSASFSLPTDLWYPVSANVAPQHAQQYALAYQVQPAKEWSFAMETYYKKMYNQLEYKEGAVVLLNNDYEKELVKGTGTAYGLEFLAKRQTGSLQVTAAYTLSWSQRHFAALNEGNSYYTRFDRRHDLSLTTTWKVTPRLHVSAVWAFATGARITPVIAQILIPRQGYSGIEMLPIYGKRNSFQLAAAHRLDISVSYSFRNKHKRESEISAGAYNVYNRTQPYRLKITPLDNGGLRYEQVGLFGFVPSVNYSIKF